MIEILSTWTKSIGLAVVSVSILEMMLPNNKTKKYIKMIMGVFVVFSIISPIIENKEKFKIEEFDIETYSEVEMTSQNIDQTSMDQRIQGLYTQELEKDIKKKIEEKGYEVTKCRVTMQTTGNKEEREIKKIKISIKKIKKEETKEQSNKEDKNLENTLVTQIQKIKEVDKVNTSVKINNKEEQEQTELKENQDNNADTKVLKSDIQNIKKFLIEEYGVSEKCLEIS